MNGPYETHACIICGCTRFVDYRQDTTRRERSYDGSWATLITGWKNDNPCLEACTLCGTVRDKNIAAERFKEKHHDQR